MTAFQKADVQKLRIGIKLDVRFWPKADIGYSKYAGWYIAGKKNKKEGEMIKMVFLVHKRPDMDSEEFSRYWRETHAPSTESHENAILGYRRIL